MFLLMVVLWALLFWGAVFFFSRGVLKKMKTTLFESGFNSLGVMNFSLSIHFFFIMLIFVLFDLELFFFLFVYFNFWSANLFVWGVVFFIMLTLLLEWKFIKLIWLL